MIAEILAEISAESAFVRDRSPEILADVSKETSALCSERTARIEASRSPSTDWNAETISVRESRAAGSTLAMMKSTLVFRELSPAILAATSVDRLLERTTSAAALIEASVDSSVEA